MKQLIPTGLDEFLTEHKEGDTVTGRIVSVENDTAQVELGEGILIRCALPTPVAEAPAAEPAPLAAIDLSAFSSMLKSKWKSGDSPATAKTSASKNSNPVRAGQVRSFRITSIDASSKTIELTFDPLS
jgi:small subunit ribosomal protein S1